MAEDNDSSQGNKPELRLPANSGPANPVVGTQPFAGMPNLTGKTVQLDNFPVIVVILLHFCTCGLFSLIWLGLMHGKLPRVRPDDPSAGRAIGFYFIPFYNLYWIFFSYRRLCLRIDEQRQVYGLPPSNLRGLATTNCIFQVIPYINIFFGYTIITPIFLGFVQSSVNQLVKQSMTTQPKATLQTLPGTPGMSGGAVAAIVCAVLVIPVTAILAALLLPALAAAKRKAQEINSVNNLKQIGLAFRVWEGDHNGQFPFNVSQAQGGTMELSHPDSNGFEQNPAPVFMVMSNELSTPKILVCPGDPDKQVATDFASLSANNISYELRTGTNINDSHPEEILAVDTLYGIVLHCDGSVFVDRSYKIKRTRF